MQSVSSRIWTRVAVSISYDYNNYTTGTSRTYRYYILIWYMVILMYVFTHRLDVTQSQFFKQGTGLINRVFANGLGDQGSIPGWIIPKTKKIVLDTSLLNTQHFKTRIKGKVEKSREWSCDLSFTSML